MSDVTGIELAIGREIGRRLHNCAFRTPTLAGLLLGLDNYYNVAANGLPKRFNVDLSGGNMLVNLVTSMAAWRSTDPTSEDIESRRVPITRGNRFKQLELECSAAEIVESINKYDKNRLKNTQYLTNFVAKNSELLVDSYATYLNDALFPATAAVGGAGNAQTKGQLMQFDFALQNGYANNNTASTLNTYMYGGLDLANNTNVQAVNVGNTSTPWVYTWKGFQTDLLMPLNDKGANVDLVLVGKNQYAYMLDELTDQIQREPSDLKFPGQMFTLRDGIFVVYESAIDRMNYEQIFVGDSSTLRFGLMEKASEAIKLIPDPPQFPSMHLLQGYLENAFFNECPRWWGRALNVTRA